MTDNNETPLKLSPDQAAVAMRELRLVLSELLHLGQLVDGGTATRNEASMLLGLAEHRISDTGKALGVPTQTEEQLKRRSEGERMANERVTQLEMQIASSMTSEQSQLSVKSSMDKFESWWRQRGLGLVSDVAISRHGNLQAELSCTLFGDFHLVNSNTPVSDKEKLQQWHSSLRERGFVLGPSSSGIGEVIDCDASREALSRMIVSALPSAEVFEYLSHATPRGKHMVLRHVKVRVRKLADIDNLPVSEEA